MNYIDALLARQEAKNTTSSAVDVGTARLLILMFAHGMPNEARDAQEISLRSKERDTYQFTAPVVDSTIPWKLYLKSITAPQGDAGSELLRRVLTFWETLSHRVTPDCPLPITQPTRDGAIQLAWNSGQKYIDIEVLPDGNFHWYFRDRETGQVLGTEDDPVEKVAPEFFAKLTELVKTQR